MRVAIDTNVLAYAVGVNGDVRKKAALDVVSALPQEAVYVPIQVLEELFFLMTRRVGYPASTARAIVLEWCDAFSPIETSLAVLLGAADLVNDHHLNFWDAIIVRAAVEANCRLLLSEDMQDGFTWEGVTVVNPFRKPYEPLFGALVAV
ncbi:MAG: PIN domain-containing protein [Candidatus Tyrphobacter sp.]